jgi:DNA-binding XRE family transcriptional regulator
MRRVHNAVSSTVSFDVTEVGRAQTRARLKESVRAAAGCSAREFARFWQYFPQRATCRRIPERTLVFADLARIAKHYLRVGGREWLASVRLTRLSHIVALVRTERDAGYAPLIGELMRHSDFRLSVCGDLERDDELRACTSEALAALDPESLLQVRYSPARKDGLWVEYADGLSGFVIWREMGLEDVVGSLVPESATVGSRGRAIELSARDGGQFEIDAAAVRALLDARFAGGLAARARDADRDVGRRVREARKAAGLTQVELGERAGLDQAVISRLERGLHVPRLDTLRRIADALDLSVAQLLSGARA